MPGKPHFQIMESLSSGMLSASYECGNMARVWGDSCLHVCLGSLITCHMGTPTLEESEESFAF